MKNNWEENVNLSNGLSPNRLHIHGSNHFTPCGIYFSNIVAETQSKEESILKIKLSGRYHMHLSNLSFNDAISR